MAQAVRTLLDVANDDIGPAESLSELLTATNSRAVGCWKLSGQTLVLVGFLAADDMPAQVQQEFVAVTKSVTLAQSKFGVVQAVLAKGPAINHRPPKPTGAKDSSPGWLERFEAASSLAVPVFDGEQIRGALAVATVARIEPCDDVWRLVTRLSRELSG
jgi:hypothetical protein